MTQAKSDQRSWLSVLLGAAFSVMTTPQLGHLIEKLLSLNPKPKPATGMYEVLEHEIALELADSTGKKAVYHKHQRVRFLQNNIIAFQDKAWGDGDIFADYRCSPGAAVDFYREGHRYNILISLRETKRQGDVEDFHIQRTILNGFVRDTEEFQTVIDHKTDMLAMSVRFPLERAPKRVWLIEQNAGVTRELGPGAVSLLADGRYEASWRSREPRLHEAYILRWQW
jgi:hypothetical protein